MTYEGYDNSFTLYKSQENNVTIQLKFFFLFFQHKLQFRLKEKKIAIYCEMMLNRTQCTTCHIKQSTYLCRRCSNDFCFRHLSEHRQNIDDEFQEIDRWKLELVAKIEQHLNEIIQSLNTNDQRN